MAAFGDLLFFTKRGPDLDDVLRDRTQRLKALIDRIPDNEFNALDDDAISDRVLKEAVVSPLTVQIDQAVNDVKETEVEVTDRFSHDLSPGETLRVPGYRVTRTIPFTGDTSLWRHKTNPWSMNGPHGKIEGQKLIIGIELPVAEAERAKAYLEQTSKSVLEHLENHGRQIERYNASLPAEIAPHILARRARLVGAADLLKKLQE